MNKGLQLCQLLFIATFGARGFESSRGIQEHAFQPRGQNVLERQADRCVHACSGEAKAVERLEPNFLPDLYVSVRGEERLEAVGFNKLFFKQQFYF